MNLLEIPEQGMMYALYKDRVVYCKYRSCELPEEEELKKNLLELHLFDESREYRYVKTRKGEIETIISDESAVYEECYVERIFTLGEQREESVRGEGCVELVNYITYDENDLMRIDDYRLREVK